MKRPAGELVRPLSTQEPGDCKLAQHSQAEAARTRCRTRLDQALMPAARGPSFEFRTATVRPVGAFEEYRFQYSRCSSRNSIEGAQRSICRLPAAWDYPRCQSQGHLSINHLGSRNYSDEESESRRLRAAVAEANRVGGVESQQRLSRWACTSAVVTSWTDSDV